MIRHFCFLCAAACSMWAVVIALFVVACSDYGNGIKEGDDGTVKLFLGKIQVPLLDSISVLVSAEDIENIYVSAKSIGEDIKIYGIPLGENRKFEVKVYADNGKLVQKGEANADIIANQTATIPISLTPLYGFLKLEIPIGLANSENIHSGTLSIDGLEFQMQIENGKGIFNTGALPLSQTLTIKVELKDPSGAILFLGEKEIMISSILQTETMQLRSNMGSAILELESSSTEPMQIVAILPTSGSRPPQKYGELFFTEIFTDPKNGVNFEYMEIYNATLDTLKLSSCRIARGRNETSASYRILMSSISATPETLILPPMEYLLLGRDSVSNADFNYKSFGLTDSQQSLGFFCDDLVVDSLYYSKTGDNPFPLGQRTAMQLPISNYANRTDGVSWCLGFSPKQDALCQ